MLNEGKAPLTEETMKWLQSKIAPKGRNKTGYETYRDLKDTLCRRIARLQSQGFCGCGNWIKNASMRLMDGGNTLAQDRGRRRLFDHMRNQGEQVETLWESGKTIRHLTREEGQVT